MTGRKRDDLNIYLNWRSLVLPFCTYNIIIVISVPSCATLNIFVRTYPDIIFIILNLINRLVFFFPICFPLFFNFLNFVLRMVASLELPTAARNSNATSFFT